MRIHVINPNSTLAMTRTIADAARSAASPGTEIDACTAVGTPPSIEGYRDEAMAVPAMLAAIIEAEGNGAQAHVIACFDDPGLSAAREVAAGPVIGICQAAVQVATTLAARFTVITTLPRSVPVIEDLIAAYGANHRCRRVRAVDMPVLALEADPEGTRNRLLAEARLAMAQDSAELIVLGCAGMSDLCKWLSEQIGIPVIDGVTAATRLAEAMIGAGYRTSKAGAFAFPRDKTADAITTDMA